ncbi:MAG: hypothetical protein HY656_08050 [Acidobacteria bacterium]|nr:hypothetical protein [Acidobacteriota bacterium]
MSSDKRHRLSRREFAGTVAVGLAPLLAGQATPALLGAGLVQEEKKPEAPKAQAPPEEERQSFLERGRKALREFSVPAETEPAFVFRAETGRG